MNKTEISEYGGMKCIRLKAGSYSALIAPEVGSNVLRLRDEKNQIEFFRFSPDNTFESLLQSAEVWGLPTLYLPNRFADGILKTSDAVYQLPVNEKEPYHNHIHGFLHKRKHTVTEHKADANCAWCRTEYIFDENDPFYEFLPVTFKAEFFFNLSSSGLEYEFKLTNLSDKQLPVSVATHTTISSPFVDGAKQEDERLFVPIGKRWVLNERCLPTGEFIDLTEKDKEYKNGTRRPVLQDIDNEMYFAEHAEYQGEPLYGLIVEDLRSKKKICYEVGEEYKFWIFWNDKGNNGYFCPEPMTAMIDAPNLDMSKGLTGYRELNPGESEIFHQHFFTLI